MLGEVIGQVEKYKYLPEVVSVKYTSAEVSRYLQSYLHV